MTPEWKPPLPGGAIISPGDVDRLRKLRRLAQRSARDSLRVLGEIVRDEDARHCDRINAAKTILRAAGVDRNELRVHVDGDMPRQFIRTPSEDLRASLQLVQGELAEPKDPQE